MKKFLIFLILPAVIACTRNTPSPSGNYIPDVPQIASDIMTPEVLWSFGRLGSPQVSPDEKSVIYTVTCYHIEENSAYRDIYSIPVAGGEAINLTQSATNEFNAIWRPDGKTVAYTCKKKNGKAYSLSTNSGIYLYHLETWQTDNFTEGMPGYDQNPVFSPDGKYLAWESMERDGYESDKNRLFLANLETGEQNDLTAAFDQNVHNLVWGKQGETIFHQQHPCDR